MNSVIGLIAEDDTDCDTVRKIIYRILGKNIKIKKWSSQGCGNLKKRLEAKLRTMCNDGCNTFIIVHDLDRNPENGSLNDEAKLRETLQVLISQVNDVKKHICIPVEELEAWFWSDPEVIQYVKGKEKVKEKVKQQKILT